MPIGSVIKNLIGGKAADIVDSVGNVVDKFVQTKEEKDAAKLELTKALNEHLEKMEAELTKQTEIYLKDNDSARNREIQIATSEKAPLINKIITPILAVLIIFLTFVLFYSVMFKQLGTEKDVVIYVLGVLSAVSTQIVSFYFGSSQGSKASGDTMRKLLENK